MGEEEPVHLRRLEPCLVEHVVRGVAAVEHEPFAADTYQERRSPVRHIGSRGPGAEHDHSRCHLILFFCFEDIVISRLIPPEANWFPKKCGVYHTLRDPVGTGKYRAIS